MRVQRSFSKKLLRLMIVWQTRKSVNSMINMAMKNRSKDRRSIVNIIDKTWILTIFLISFSVVEVILFSKNSKMAALEHITTHRVMGLTIIEKMDNLMAITIVQLVRSYSHFFKYFHYSYLYFLEYLWTSLRKNLYMLWGKVILIIYIRRPQY